MKKPLVATFLIEHYLALLLCVVPVSAHDVISVKVAYACEIELLPEVRVTPKIGSIIEYPFVRIVR